MAGVLTRKGKHQVKTDTHKENLCDDRGGDWSDASTGPRVASRCQQLGAARKDYTQPQRGHGPADTLMSNFQPLNFCC